MERDGNKISLLFKGCSGYKKEFGGHQVGQIKEYDSEKAIQLLRDMSDGFEIISKKNSEIEENKETFPAENKMIGEPKEKKEVLNKLETKEPSSSKRLKRRQK